MSQTENEPLVQDPVVAEYYREGFLRELVARGGLARKATPTADTQRYALYHGVDQLPAELEQFLRMRDEHEFVYHALGEWRIWGDDVWLPDPDRGNLAEQLVLRDQEDYLGTAMVEYAANCILIGTAGNGDGYFASLDPRAPERCEVVFWDHETHSIDFATADSVSSLAYVNHLLAAVHDSEDDEETEVEAGTEAEVGTEDGEASGDAERDSAGRASPTLDEIAEAFGRIADRTLLPWHYSTLEEVAGREASVAGSDMARFCFYRSLWLMYLLRNDSVHQLSAVEQAFGVVDHQKADLERVLAGPHLRRRPETAFYWLWRLFFFDKDADLRRVLEVTKDSENPLVRDLALLVEELRAGRRRLGSIEDVHELRRRFLALDLDPDRAEAREAEQRAAEQAAAGRRAADERVAAELVATRSPAELTELAWDHLDSEVVVPAIHRHLREVDDELRADLTRLAFWLEGGHHRGHHLYQEEARETLEAIGHAGSPRLAPLLLATGHHHLLPAVGRLGDRRALPHLVPRLAVRGEHHHELRHTVRAVAALGARDQVPTLLAMLDEFTYDPGDYLTAISHKDLLREVMAALAELGDPAAAAPLAAVLASGHPDLATSAVVALGRLGHPDAVPLLLDQLAGPRARPSMWQLAGIGDPRALEPVRAAVDRLGGVPERVVYERVMLEALRAACKEPVDLEPARFALGVVEANRFESAELHEAAIGLLAGHASPDEVVALVAPFRDAEQQRVREAALAALAAVGAPAGVHYYDRATVDAIAAADGVEGLRAALRDPLGALRHNLARKAVDEGWGEELAGELADYGRTLLRFEHYTYSYVKDGWNRLDSGLTAVAAAGTPATDRVADDALTHPSPMVRKVFQYHADDLKERLGRTGPVEPRSPRDRPPADRLRLATRELGAAPWSLGGMINGLAFTPDGERVVVVGAGSRAAAVVDREGRVVLPLPAVRGHAYDVDVHPDGSVAAIGLHGGHLLLVDLATGELLADLRGHGGVPDGVRKVRFSPSGRLLASASDDESLVVWDVASRTALCRLVDTFDVNTVDWFPDETGVVFGTDKQVGILPLDPLPDGPVGEPLDEDAAGVRRVDRLGVAEVRVFAGGSRIAVGGAGRSSISILDDRLRRVTTLRQRDVARIRLLPGEEQLVAASWDGEHSLVRWDLSTGERTALPGHDDYALFALDLDPRTGEPYAGGSYGTVVSWQGDTLREDRTPHHTSEIQALAVAGSDLYSAASDGVVRWSLADGAPVRRYTAADRYRASAVAVSPDGATVLATGHDGAVAFDTESGAELWRADVAGRSEVAHGIEGAFVVGSRDLLVWLDAATGELRHTEQVDDGGTLGLWHLLPLDGERAVVAAYRRPRLQRWHLTERRREAVTDLPARSGEAETYAMGLGGGRLVVSRWDNSLDSLDVVGAGALEHRVEVRTSLPYAPVAVSPDGALVAAGERELRLLDAGSFDLLAERSIGGPVSALAFTAPRQLVAGLKDGRLLVVDLDGDGTREAGHDGQHDGQRDA